MPKFGLMHITPPPGQTIEPLNYIGAAYGYGIAPGIVIEAEFIAGVSGGEYRQEVEDNEDDSGEYKVYTVAAYLVNRYSLNKTAYLIGKLGLQFNRIETTGDEYVNTCFNEFLDCYGLAGGIGFGFVLRQFLTLEAEIIQMKRDITLLNFGVHYPF